MSQSIVYNPAPTVSKFIKDYIPGELFYNFIVGPVGCVPADTEYLTPTGWRHMDTYTAGDAVGVWKDGVVTFEQVEYVKEPAATGFHTFVNGGLAMELSPQHRVPYYDYRGKFQVTTAAHMAEKPGIRKIPTTFALARERTGMSDAEIRLRVAFSADGHIPKAGSQRMIVVRKDRKKVRLRELLRAFGLAWTEVTYPQRPTETLFKFRWAGADKSLEFVWGLSTAQLAIVIDEVTHWDGLHDHEERRYYTTISAHADAIQFAAHASGLRARIGRYEDQRNAAWAPNYTVYIRNHGSAKNAAFVSSNVTRGVREAPDGMQYCFVTSTGFFVARCRGTVFVTGNSSKTTGIFFKLVYMAGLQKPGPDGIRRSRAVIVRNTSTQLRDTTLNSWFTWFKDGQAGKWHATDKVFVLRYGDVECEVLFRPLDTPQDVARVLSLEITFAIVDEFIELPQAIIDALSARCGRYPSKINGGATNFGLWASSNTSTEDNWWFDYLHNAPGVVQPGEDQSLMYRLATDMRNARYFLQPSGFSPLAENIDNLPGGRDYYTNQAKNKSEAYIKQYLEAEWGYSVAGKPVLQSFHARVHISRKRLHFNPNLPLIGGYDPGIGGAAMVFGQEDLEGRLHMLGEITTSGVGAARFVTERLRPYLSRNFPELRPGNFIIAPDPAAGSRSSNDESTIVDTLKRHYPVSIESNNRLPLRLDAIDYYCTRMIYGLPSLLVDEQACPSVVRAFKGGWRYALDNKEQIKEKGRGAVPEKNVHSHVADAATYLARYFHRQVLKNDRYTQGGTARAFVPPRSFGGSSYHQK